MYIEIITIGDEILSGNVVDTNTAYLSDRLWLNGFEVAYHTAVRDDAEKIKEVLLHAAQRAQVVIVTGGLGPTVDDFTLEVAAKAFRKNLVRDEAVLAYLQDLFKKWGRPLSENNQKQALVPEGSKTYQNRIGTAPGVGISFKECRFYFLPGVPKEMQQLFEDFVLPEIISSQKKKKFFESKVLKCFGAAESDLDAALKDLYENRLNIQQVRIGFRPHFPEISIKLSAWDEEHDQAKHRITSAEAQIRERIGKYIYGEGEDTLESVVGNLLRKKRKTLALAESCTGGLVSHRITNVPGASLYFKNAVVSYDNEAKIHVLGVSAETIEKFGAVSSECAVEMAQCVRRISKADFGISITGIAGPTGGTDAKPVGTVHIALAHANGTEEKKYFFPRQRDWFKLLASSVALDRLRRHLLEA